MSSPRLLKRLGLSLGIAVLLSALTGLALAQRFGTNFGNLAARASLPSVLIATAVSGNVASGVGDCVVGERLRSMARGRRGYLAATVSP